MECDEPNALESMSESSSSTEIDDNDFQILLHGIQNLKKSKESPVSQIFQRLIADITKGASDIEIEWSLEELALESLSDSMISEFLASLRVIDIHRAYRVLSSFFEIFGYHRFLLARLNELQEFSSLYGAFKGHSLDFSSVSFRLEDGLHYSEEIESLLSPRNNILKIKNASFSLEEAIRGCLYEVGSKNIKQSKESSVNFFLGLAVFQSCITKFENNLDISYLYLHFLYLHLDIYKSDERKQLKITTKLFVHSRKILAYIHPKQSPALRNLTKLVFLNFANLALLFRNLKDDEPTKESLKICILSRKLSLESLLSDVLRINDSTDDLILHYIEVYFFSNLAIQKDKPNVLEIMLPILEYVKTEMNKLSLKRKKILEVVSEMKFSLSSSRIRPVVEASFFLEDLEEAQDFISFANLAEANGYHKLFELACDQALKALHGDFTAQRIIAHKLLRHLFKRNCCIALYFTELTKINKIFVVEYRFSCFQAKSSRKLKLRENGWEILRLLESLPGEQKRRQMKPNGKRKAVNAGVLQRKEDKVLISNTRDVNKVQPKSLKLFLFNLNYKSTEKDLYDFLSKLGIATKSIQILKGRNRGQSIVEVNLGPNQTLDTIKQTLSAKDFIGRKVSVEEFKSKRKRKQKHAKLPKQKAQEAKTGCRVAVKNALPSTVTALKKLSFRSDAVAEEISRIAPISGVELAQNQVTLFLEYESESAASRVIQYFEQKSLAHDETLTVERYFQTEKDKKPLQTVSLSKSGISRRQRPLLVAPQFSRQTYQTTGKRSNEYFRSLLGKGAPGR